MLYAHKSMVEQRFCTWKQVMGSVPGTSCYRAMECDSEKSKYITVLFLLLLIWYWEVMDYPKLPWVCPEPSFEFSSSNH